MLRAFQTITWHLFLSDAQAPGSRGRRHCLLLFPGQGRGLTARLWAPKAIRCQLVTGDTSGLGFQGPWGHALPPLNVLNSSIPDRIRWLEVWVFFPKGAKGLD